MAISGFKNPFSHVRITTDIKEDLLVWQKFLIDFNGRSVWQGEFVLDQDFQLFTDSAGSLGFAAIWQTYWCAEPWPMDWKLKGLLSNSVLLELFPIIVAIEIWSKNVKNRRLLCSTDNKGVLYAINCLSSKSKPVIILLRYVYL